MSQNESRELIENVGSRVDTLARLLPFPELKDPMQALGRDIRSVLLEMLSRIEVLEDQLRKES